MVSYFNPLSADILLYKPWRPKCFFQFYIILNVLVSSFWFIWISMLCVYKTATMRNMFTFNVRGSIFNVRIWRLQTFKVDPHAARILELLEPCIRFRAGQINRNITKFDLIIFGGYWVNSKLDMSIHKYKYFSPFEAGNCFSNSSFKWGKIETKNSAAERLSITSQFVLMAHAKFLEHRMRAATASRNFSTL